MYNLVEATFSILMKQHGILEKEIISSLAQYYEDYILVPRKNDDLKF